MSRTKKTRPLAIRAADRTDGAVEVVLIHDHTNGVCEAEGLDVTQVLDLENGRGKCHAIVAPTGQVGICGCRWCSGYYERRWERRRERHSARREIAEQLQDV